MASKHIHFLTPLRKLPVLTFHICCLHIYMILITNYYTKRKIYSEETKSILDIVTHYTAYYLTELH